MTVDFVLVKLAGNQRPPNGCSRTGWPCVVCDRLLLCTILYCVLCIGGGYIMAIIGQRSKLLRRVVGVECQRLLTGLGSGNVHPRRVMT
jgi:hypothetical protein